MSISVPDTVESLTGGIELGRGGAEEPLPKSIKAPSTHGHLGAGGGSVTMKVTAAGGGMRVEEIVCFLH
jgi:hypothetical protein